MGRLREEIVAVGKSVGGDVPNHDAVAIAIPHFFLGGGASGVLEQAATALEIEESKVISLLLQLLEYVEFVNPKSLRDPRDMEWWEEGLRGALMKLASMAGGLDLEKHPSFRQLLEWKDAIERPDLGDSYDRIRSDSEDIDLPDSRANDAPREHKLLAKRYAERVAAHELAAYLGWMTLEGNGRSFEIYQSFREDLCQARLDGTHPFSPLDGDEIPNLEIRRLTANLFRGEDDDRDGV